MVKECIRNSNLNWFLRDVKLKKNYIEKLQGKLFDLHVAYTNKNYKSSFFILPKYESLSHEDSLVVYIINVTFSRTNTLLHVMDFAGKLKFFSSAGLVKYSGKSKKSRFSVLRDLYRSLFAKLKGLGSKPVALHLMNVGSHKFWIIEKFKKKFYIKVVKSFNSYPYNGCRKKKAKRKQF